MKYVIVLMDIFYKLDSFYLIKKGTVLYSHSQRYEIEGLVKLKRARYLTPLEVIKYLRGLKK